jgi:hypothetical protein
MKLYTFFFKVCSVARLWRMNTTMVWFHFLDVFNIKLCVLNDITATFIRKRAVTIRITVEKFKQDSTLVMYRSMKLVRGYLDAW